MATPLRPDPASLDLALESLDGETDRGAAVLAGSMVENLLGLFLKDHCSKNVNRTTLDKLFGSTGPISTFSQRSLVAAAFGLISREDYLELNRVRSIRNHFAHHPLEAEFKDEDIRKDVLGLRFYAFASINPEMVKQGTERMAYLLSCARLIGHFEGLVEHSASGA